MNILSIKIAKLATTKYGVRDPTNMDIPKRMSTNPRYMGFLVNRNTPLVIKTVESSNGLTVVLYFLNALSMIKFIARPNVMGIAPRRFQGKNMIFNIGCRKCKTTIAKMEITELPPAEAGGFLSAGYTAD